jgi:hypothetical protein
LGQGYHSFAVGVFGQSQAGVFGDDDVGVVQEPVDGGGGEGLGPDRVESSRVQSRGKRDRSAFVGGVDAAVKRLGGLPGGKHAEVVD